SEKMTNYSPFFYNEFFRINYYYPYRQGIPIPPFHLDPDMQGYFFEEGAAISTINLEREKFGLSNLWSSRRLKQLTRIRAADIAKTKQCTSHISQALGGDEGVQLKNAGINPARSVANIYCHSGPPDPIQAVKWWMNSPGHRANILNKDIKLIAISVNYTAYDNQSHWSMIATSDFNDY
ncbi:hypothetical protein CON45_26020, partial [Priestia megaterium]|uniref:CAP domain-containing protein n=1 Tax=Priestia megaterium TaxID=1404 RepID=UPI000BEC4512